MLENSIRFIKCIKCNGKLDVDIYKNSSEIDEGVLKCKKCQLVFPVIDKIPIMFMDFQKYLSEHKILSGKLYRLSSTQQMKDFLKSSLNNLDWDKSDKTLLEERWSKIYENNKNSKFYKLIKSHIESIPKLKLVLEYGCSIGIITTHSSKSNEMVFGIDKSFNAIQIAKQNKKNNIDYVVSDFKYNPFLNTKFDLIIALNVLELMEPEILLKQISKQISLGYVIISDPYDFERGNNSVKNPMNEILLRKKLKNLKFKITSKTRIPSNIQWNLKLYDRASLNYKVDIIIAKKDNV
jgi:uncharacterized protein YbaR (Trm112 family)